MRIKTSFNGGTTAELIMLIHHILFNLGFLDGVSICFLNHRDTEVTGKYRDYPRLTWCRCVSVV